MGKNILNIDDANKVIDKIEELYNSVGISTNLNDYINGDKEVISKITTALKNHNMTALGEKGNLTLDKVEQILTLALKPKEI